MKSSVPYSAFTFETALYLMFGTEEAYIKPPFLQVTFTTSRSATKTNNALCTFDNLHAFRKRLLQCLLSRLALSNDDLV